MPRLSLTMMMCYLFELRKKSIDKWCVWGCLYDMDYMSMSIRPICAYTHTRVFICAPVYMCADTSRISLNFKFPFSKIRSWFCSHKGCIWVMSFTIVKFSLIDLSDLYVHIIQVSTVNRAQYVLKSYEKLYTKLSILIFPRYI